MWRVGEPRHRRCSQLAALTWHDPQPRTQGRRRACDPDGYRWLTTPSIEAAVAVGLLEQIAAASTNPGLEVAAHAGGFHRQRRAHRGGLAVVGEV